MWLERTKALELLFSLSEKIDILPYIKNEKNNSFLSFDFYFFDGLVNAVDFDGDFVLYEESTDYVNKNDFKFLKQTLKKLKISFYEEFENGKLIIYI